VAQKGLVRKVVPLHLCLILDWVWLNQSRPPDEEVGCSVHAEFFCCDFVQAMHGHCEGLQFCLAGAGEHIKGIGFRVDSLILSGNGVSSSKISTSGLGTARIAADADSC
jgi:hypothetical protein